MGIDTGKEEDEFLKTATTSEIRIKIRKMIEKLFSIRRGID